MLRAMTLLLALACNRTPTCPTDMAVIPAGTAQLGGTGKDFYLAPQTVEHDAYCIDHYEYPNRVGEKPHGQYSWDEADAACTAIGKRLCTDIEWGRACRGPEGRQYSYGNTRDAEICNTPIEGGGPGKSHAPVKPAGTFPDCVTPEGVYDLNGSMSEWTSDSWAGEPEPFDRGATVTPERWRTLRGGTMWNHTFYGQDCLSRHGHDRDFRNMDDGFRCCADAG